MSAQSANAAMRCASGFADRVRCMRCIPRSTSGTSFACAGRPGSAAGNRLSPQRFELLHPRSKVRALPSHGFDTDGPRSIGSVQNLAVIGIEVLYAFRRRCVRVVVDIFRCGESVADLLKFIPQRCLVDGCGKSLRIAEQQALVFMQLQVRDESYVG